MGYQQQSTWGVSAFLSLRFTSSQFKGDLFLPSAEHHQQPTKCLEKQRKPLLTPWRASETRWSTWRTPKRQLPIWRRVFRTASPNSTRFSRPKITKIENSLDDTTEKLEAATVGLEDAEKRQLVNEEEVSALQRRFSLLDDDIARSDGRLQVESAKLAEAAAAAEAVEIQRKTLEGISFVNDERMDTLEEQIEIAREVALRSTRNAEEVARKLAMTQVDHERTTEKCKEAEVKCDELEKELNVVGANMKTLELSETNALKRHEDAEEKIRDLILNLKFAEIQAAAAEREAAKLQQELELLVAELNDWKEKYGEICVELEQTFNEMAGY